jgi:hypothetical protein
MSEELADEDIVCATYTHARRHPMVLGQIGGWTPPFQLTLMQVAVLLLGFWFEYQTWHLWGGHLPRTLGVVVFLAVPASLAWLTRHARAEGRSLPRAIIGWLMMAFRSRAGRVGGRPYRPARPSSPGRTAVYVAPGDTGGWGR